MQKFRRLAILNLDKIKLNSTDVDDQPSTFRGSNIMDLTETNNFFSL